MLGHADISQQKFRYGLFLAFKSQCMKQDDMEILQYSPSNVNSKPLILFIRPIDFYRIKTLDDSLNRQVCPIIFVRLVLTCSKVLFKMHCYCSFKKCFMLSLFQDDMNAADNKFKNRHISNLYLLFLAVFLSVLNHYLSSVLNYVSKMNSFNQLR